MALRRLGVLVVAAVVGLVVGVPPALGTESSGEKGRIAFASQRRDGNDFDIWLMRPDGSHLVNLTADSEANETEPSWRPDGRKLAFMSNRVTAANPGPDPDFEIFVMNADGSGVRQLTVNNVVDEAPNWSPDGRRLVFHRNLDPKVPWADYEHGNYEVSTMQANGTHQRNLTNSPDSQELFPDWSPNGRRISLTATATGIATSTPCGPMAPGCASSPSTTTGSMTIFRHGPRMAAALPSPAASHPPRMTSRTMRSIRCVPTAVTRPG
jgi:Tol biopolymer transport system component